MPGTLIGMLDCLGFLFIAFILFLPVIWLAGYCLIALFRSRRHLEQHWSLIELSNAGSKQEDPSSKVA